ncbi:MAG: CBS domain-containing protein [Candidatus Bathyarchaeota archaeon]|nr:CBS domain-containing protein [Candidatus Bathyarchaeota archaeon]
MSSRFEPGVLVKDIMTSQVISVSEEESVERTAKLMDEHDIGSIIITDEKGRPIGIITERDIVKRVVAKNLLPSKIHVKEIMSAPLITISPREKISEAARKMSRLGVRRLVVVQEGNLIGIVTSKDIVGITPELISVITERATISERALVRERAPLAGYCDRCGQWSDLLKEVNGEFLCDECRLELET